MGCPLRTAELPGWVLGRWVLGAGECAHPVGTMVISDRDPDWSRVRQACPVRKGYISVGRGFVGHGIRAEAPSDRREPRQGPI
jgi:hypothetical protein